MGEDILLKSDVRPELVKINRTIWNAVNLKWLQTRYECRNNKYDNGKMSQYLSRTIFIVMLMNPGSNECEHYREINLIKHVSKPSVRILINREQN